MGSTTQVCDVSLPHENRLVCDINLRCALIRSLPLAGVSEPGAVAMGSATQVCDVSLPHETDWALCDCQLKLRLDPVATARGSDTMLPQAFCTCRPFHGLRLLLMDAYPAMNRWVITVRCAD